LQRVHAIKLVFNKLNTKVNRLRWDRHYTCCVNNAVKGAVHNKVNSLEACIEIRKRHLIELIKCRGDTDFTAD
jgi:hypothetical protein